MAHNERFAPRPLAGRGGQNVADRAKQQGLATRSGDIAEGTVVHLLCYAPGVRERGGTLALPSVALVSGSPEGTRWGVAGIMDSSVSVRRKATTSWVSASLNTGRRSVMRQSI